MPRMKDIIIDTFLCVRNQMNPNSRKNVFELFGFDFLLDEEFRIWLIECNTNPYLGTPNAYMKDLMPKMMNDMFKIVLDPVLKPKNTPEADRENQFELLYRESHIGSYVNVRRPFNHELLYPIPSLKPDIGTVVKINTAKATQSPAQRRVQPKPDLMLTKSPYLESPLGEAPSATTSMSTKNRSKSMSASNPKFLSRKNQMDLTSKTYGSVERKNLRVSGSGSNKRGRKKHHMTKDFESQIIEQVAEEDSMSAKSDTYEEIKEAKMNLKKNHLCRSLLEQTRELCY